MILLGVSSFLASCGDGPEPVSESWGVEKGALAPTQVLLVTVTLDGEPVVGVEVVQGGNTSRWITDSEGRATIVLDTQVEGDLFVMALHPEARTRGSYVFEGDTESVVALERFSPVDNEEYEFKSPGEYGNALVLWECGHCHHSTNDEFEDSVHRTASSNPVLYDVYQGRHGTIGEEEACLEQGGEWKVLPSPGGQPEAPVCVVAPAVQDFGTNGDCANCHAPGINGKVGGRDLLEADGIAYEYGVHCDVCHRVESVDLEAESPGIGGVLRIVRPLDKPFSAQLGDWLPLAFGPDGDVVNANMGSVGRALYHEATMCAGCHQQDQAVLVPGVSIDTERWPSGKLPVHSTYAEWDAGPMNPEAPCQSCHMPPNPTVENTADLQLVKESLGVVAGWYRPPGMLRKHTWYGPRSEEHSLLNLAAAIFLEKTVDDGVLTVDAKVKNVGPGHAIPTGEPMRSMVLRVQATCDGEALTATGGSVVPDFGGYLERRGSDEDWSTWETPQIGQQIRVVSFGEDWLDYKGFGPFGDGTFSPEEKGMRSEFFAGASSILDVVDGEVVLDEPLPEGDVAYLVEADAWPEDLSVSTGLAGAPGFGFARVMVGVDGGRMVPHYRAVDVASDNRLLPQESWTSTHVFESSCAEPEVRAVLIHRAYPYEESRIRGWNLFDRVMTEGRR